MAQRLRILALVAGIAASLALLDLLRAPEGTRIWSAIFDAGHAPLFGGIALMVLGLSRRLCATRLSAPAHYGVAFAVSLALGVASEALQFFLPRDSDPADVLRNAAGALAFLAVHAALEPQRVLIRRRSRRVAAATVGVLVLAAVLVPVVAALDSYTGRDRAFPVLCDFESRWCRDFVKNRRSTVRFVEPPASWPAPAPRSVARVLLSPSRGPNVSIEEPRPDWSGFTTLALDVFCPGSRPAMVRLAVDDRLERRERVMRFDRPYVLEPGLNRLRIPLEEIRQGPLLRTLDTDRVRLVTLYATSLDHPVELYLAPLRLER